MVRRLVQQQQARRLADGAGELGTLTLAARQLIQPRRGIRGQAHLVQRVVDPVVDFGGGQQSAMGQCAQGDIVVQQQPSVGIVVLADIGDPTGPLGAGKLRIGSAVQLDPPGRRRHQTRQQPDQRALARAVQTNDGEDLAREQMQRDRVQQHSAVRGTIALPVKVQRNLTVAFVAHLRFTSRR